jgi:ribosomal protein S18 acetylase RimI-like enzyme
MPFTIERCHRLKSSELDQLCEATEEAIRDGIGFNWQEPPSRETLEKYWQGVLLIPERELFLARLDGVIAGAIQGIKPSKRQETTAFALSITEHFVTPWARGYGIAKALLNAAEQSAAMQGYSQIRLSVRSTQKAAIHLYEAQGYHCWGILKKHELVNGVMVAGHYFSKDIKDASA